MTSQRPDSAETRKARGAFFTPDGITEHLAEWAIQDATDLVMEPSAGEAAFLVAAVRRLQQLGNERPEVHGVEIHPPSADLARQYVQDAGGTAAISVQDFFLVEPRPRFSAVIGNPPFVRYQDFAGSARDRARFAALRQGVALSGLASSWAAFVVHSAAQLKPGGRLGLVLPAELLTVNYAAPVRRFLLENFASVELVVFEEQVFDDAEADTVLVKALGWQGKPTDSARLRQTKNAESLKTLSVGTTWSTVSSSERWTPVALAEKTLGESARLLADGHFAQLAEYGDTSLGAVTGANHYFALSPERVSKLGIPRRDLLRISPPGSGHLRGLALTETAMTRLGKEGRATWLLYPSANAADATLRYVQSGHLTGVDEAYKCRVRSNWWKVPVLDPPDLFLTYMNADTPRLTTNAASARHLNSVHGVYFKDDVKLLARDVLPIASVNSFTLLSAELTGRSYGGGILKLEPREADRWWVPSPQLLQERQGELSALKPRVQRLLRRRNLLGAAALVDEVLFGPGDAALDAIRADHRLLSVRRTVRGKSGRQN